MTVQSHKLLARGRRIETLFKLLGFVATVIGLLVLLVLFLDVARDGAGRLSWQFLLSYPSRHPAAAGIFSAWVGTVWVMLTTAVLVIPLGVLAGIYLEEYARKSWLTTFIEMNIANLAGVPSIVYGLLGLGLFVRGMGLGRSVLAGAATLALVVLPMIILATREALRAVPFSIRESSYALGATQWQTVFRQVVPVALPGILTGVILGMSRAIGETAPLIMIGALTYVAFVPELSFLGFLDPFTVLPIQIFNWVSRPQAGFIANAAAGILVLLALTLAINSVAIWLRQRYHKRLAH